MTTLVTGGAGFIGSYVAGCLLERGERVVVLDSFDGYYDPAIKRSNVSRLERAGGLELVEGDVRDGPLLERVLSEHGVRRIAHLAALAGVRSSIEQSVLYTEVNALGTAHVLEAARRARVERVVLGSTSSVYAKSQRLPFREDDPADRPLAAYPASKRAAELLGHSFHHLFGLDITVLRFFNVYGPAGRPDMMPLRLMRAAVGGETIPVFGGGALERDWSYIDDTVQGVLAALERSLGYEIINLGLGQPIALSAFIEIVEELAGRRIKTRDAETPPSEPPVTYCDNSKARRLLGFNPAVQLREGLTRTWEWFREAEAQG